jgi:hypothetical protein
LVPAPEASTAIRASTSGRTLFGPVAACQSRHRYANRVRETAGPTTARPGRCVHHPGVAAVGTCQVCARAVCIACAVPVRGTIVGPECLAAVLDRAPDPLLVPPPISPLGDWLAQAGFGVVLALSLLPWSRVGEGARVLGAWAVNWSLLAAVGALAGLAVALFARHRSVDPRLTASAYAILAMTVALGALLHVVRPPLLAEASVLPVFALVGSAAALLGAVLKARALVAAGRLNG